MSASARLDLPFILPSQAQKHVTHNEALQRLDALVQLVVEEVGAETPPATPEDGAIWALGPAPTGAWAGQAGMLAQWADPAWLFVAPQQGWRGWNKAADAELGFQAGVWSPVAPVLQAVDGVGIATTWDATNRLALASEASLFSHAGAGHQIKVNKSGAGDTASLMFQTGWSGRAEMGTTGNDDFSLKVSVDGNGWTEALRVDAATGLATGAAVQSSATDVTAGRLARADYAYGPGNLLGLVSEASGVPTGAVIERGGNANGEYMRLADGTQICTHQADFDTGAPTTIADYPFPASFAGGQIPFLDRSIATSIAGANLGDLDDIARLLTVSFNSAGVWRLRARSYAGSDIGTVPFRLVAIGRWF